METLVELYQGKEARVSTFNVWKGFGYGEHRAFKKIIWEHRSDFEEFGVLFESSTVDANRKRGGQEKSYLLNEDQFTLLVAYAKNTPESRELKKRIVKEFFRMRRTLASMVSVRSSEEWQSTRIDGKGVHRQKTDAIKQFVEYCEKAGWDTKWCYVNLAKMENNALFIFEQKYPNVREVLNIKQLGQVMVADQIIEKTLLEEMEKGAPPKRIFEICKDRVIQFSQILGKSMVIDMIEQTRQLQHEG